LINRSIVSDLKFNFFLLLILNLLVSSARVMGQQNSFYYTQPQYRSYLSYLVLSGNIDPRFSLVQPFHADELVREFKKNDQLKTKLDKNIIKDLETLCLRDTTTDKWITDARTELKSSKEAYWNLSLGSGYQHRDFKIRYQLTIDPSYERDSLYFGTTGKLGKSNISRANEAYIEWSPGNHRLFMGRMNRNLGIINDNGLLISSNPLSYDQLNYIYRNDRMQFMTLFTRLNDQMSYDIRSIPVDTFLATRFMSLHRLDVRLNKKMTIAFTESIIFGGRDKFPQLKYLNPANIFFFSKMNDRKADIDGSANSFLTMEFQYKASRKLTLYSQFLLDDMDFTKSLREKFPDRIGLQSQAILTDLIPRSMLSFKFNHISNWTYNSFYTWGNATFYGKSLGFPTHGSQEIEMDFKSFAKAPFIFEAAAGAGRFRKQELDKPFPGTKSDFPIGQEEKFLKYKLSLSWIPNRNMTAGLQIEQRFIENHQNIIFKKLNLLTISGNIQIFGIFDMLKK